MDTKANSQSQDLAAVLAADQGTTPEVLNRPIHNGRGYRTGHAGGHGKSKYSADLAQEICDGLQTGKGIATLCRANPHWPSEGTIRGWILNPPEAEFAAMYARARDLGYRAWSEQILEIADDSSADLDDDGKPKREIVERSKLRVSARQWLLSKLVPKTYGDKLDVTTRDETETVDIVRLNRMMLQAFGIRDGRTIDGMLSAMGLVESTTALPAPAGEVGQ